MKLTQKLLCLKASLALVAAHRSSCQITYGWLDVRGSIRDVFIGWGQGVDWREKVTVQNCGRPLVKPKSQPGGVVLAP